MTDNARKQAHPKLIALACARALAAEDYLPSNGFRVIRMPCSSKVEPVQVLRAFEAGARGVVLVPCASEACQYVEGNLRARSMAVGTASLLSEVGIDPQRFSIYPLDKEDRNGLKGFLDAFADRITNLGDWL